MPHDADTRVSTGERPLRVLLTPERFVPDIAGGGEPWLADLTRHLHARGVDVRVLTSGDPRLTHFEGVPTTRLPIHRYRLNLALGAITRLARGVDLIHTFSYNACLPSWLAGRRTGRPVVLTGIAFFGDTWKEMKGPIVGGAFMAFERLVLTRPYARTIFLSDHTRELGVSMGVVRTRTAVIEPAIDLGAFTPAPEKEDVVLFVGKLEVRKGIREVLAAATALPSVRFRLLSYGGDSGFRSGAPPNVEFHSLEPGPKLAQAYARARLFVLPTKAEGFPLSLVQAMASGCAVVSTLPVEFAGARVRPGSVSDLVSAIGTLWPRREESLAMGRRNRELAARYGWDRTTESLISLYREVLDERARRA